MSALLLASVAFCPCANANPNENAKKMKYQLEALEYPYDALEPYIDAETVKIHHDKHQAAYVDKLNAAIESEASFSPDLPP